MLRAAAYKIKLLLRSFTSHFDTWLERKGFRHRACRGNKEKDEGLLYQRELAAEREQFLLNNYRH